MSGNNLTRIQNNQITDSTIQGQAKIAAGSITGNLLASSVTFNSNITILGNLTVSNSYTQLNSINTYINDPIVVFNNGYSGSLTNYDIGILVNRNLASLGAYGSVNTFLGWSESAGAFIGVATTETGTSVSSINNSGYANLIIGNTTMVSGSVTNNLSAGSITSPSATIVTLNSTSGNVTTLVATNLSSGNAQISGGAITGTPISGSTGAFTTAQATNFSTGNAVITGGYLTGLANVYATTAQATNFSTGNALITGGTLSGISAFGATTLVATNFSTGNAVISGGYISSLANAAITSLSTTTAVASNFSTANAVITGGSLNSTPIGATTASTGAFTTLTTSGVSTVNGNLVAASGTASGSTTTGALVVVGGAGISGNTNIGGTTIITASVPNTGASTGALQVLSGGAYISGNLWLGGNINVTGNTNIISANSGSFFGNAAGFGALYSGISSGYTYQGQTVIQASTNFNGYAQVNHQNINGGANASTDFVATADAGSATAGFIDMGINSSGFVGGTGNELNYPLDGYLLVTGTTNTNGNLLISTNQQSDIVFSANGQGTSNEIGRFQYNGGSTRLLLKTTTAATSTTTGALTVGGGAGIAGALYAGSVYDNGNRVVSTSTGSGNLSISGTAVTLTATGPGATTVGSTTAIPVITTDAYGRVTALSSAALSTSYTLNGTSGATSVANGSTLSLAGTYGVTVTVGTEYANIATPQDLRTTASPTFTGLQVTTEVATNFSSGNAVITGGSVNGSPIGASSASTGAFTTLTTTGTAIASGNVVAAATTASTNTTTGALVVAGGVGVAGDMNVGGNLKVSGTLTYINTTTELVGGIEIVAGNLVANSGTASSNTTSGALVVTGGAGFSGSMYVGGAINAGSITGTPISGSTGAFTTAQATNFSTGNAVITGGYASGLANVYATTAQATNFSTGNALITGGTLSGLTALNVTTETATNFASGNAQITGGAINGTPISGSTGAFTTAQATNFSSGNAVISGGYISSLSNATITAGTVTTLVATNFSSGNAQITGGALSGVTIASTSSYDANFSSPNVVVSGGYISALSNATVTTAVVTNFSSGNAVITGGSITGDSSGNFTTLQGTNFSTGNAVITGGRVDGTTVGAFTPSTGAFTTLNASGATTLNTLSTSGISTVNGNLVAASGTGSVSTTTGALVVVGGAGISGNINVGTSTSLHNIQGNLLLGLGTAASGAVTTLEVNQNVDTPQTSTSVVHISAKTSSNGKVTLDSFGTGTTSFFIARASRGTSTTPTAVQSGDILGGFVARGYGTTGYLLGNAAVSAGLSLVAYDNFTDATQGTSINLSYIPTGSNLAVAGFKMSAGSGNVNITSATATTSSTTGALVVAGGIATNNNLYVNGTTTIGGVTTHASNVVIASGTNSVSSTTGGLVLAGGAGAGIGGNLNVAGNTYVTGISYIGPISSAIGLSNPLLVGTHNVNGDAQVVIQNTSNGNNASTDFVATSNNGTDTTNYIDVGINGSGFSQASWTVSGANDGYMYVDGGNLTLGTDTLGKTVAIHVGGTYANNIVATFNANNVQPTSSTTGTMVVTGGVGISGNLNIGNAAVFNSTQTAGADVIVKGQGDTTLLWSRPSSTYDQVLIGGSASASTLIRGAKLQINSTDSILIPVGTNAQRPSNTGGTDIAGMLRFNSTTNGMEIYNGTAWQSFSTSFTVITDQQFNGTGSQTAFTLNSAQTTASCVVSVNGVLQIPTLAYSVSGTTLTFTEAPASTDIIDVRCLTTTSTVTAISSINGYMGFTADNYGANVTTGTGSAVTTTSWNTSGAQVSFVPNVAVASANTATIIDTIDNTQYRSAKYVIQVTNGANYQVQEVLVISNGTTATSVAYGTLQTNGNLGVVQTTQSGTNTLVQFIAANATNNVRVKKDYIAI